MANAMTECAKAIAKTGGISEALRGGDFPEMFSCSLALLLPPKSSLFDSMEN